MGWTTLSSSTMIRMVVGGGWWVVGDAREKKTQKRRGKEVGRCATRHETGDPGRNSTRPGRISLPFNLPSYRRLLIPPAYRGSCRTRFAFPEFEQIMIFQVPASLSACHGPWEPSPFLHHGRR